ncbi:mitochondrial carrier [Biscogniauxia marginata]|nr:mitochondrial carrier [Biscogniauxia marginata]
MGAAADAKGGGEGGRGAAKSQPKPSPLVSLLAGGIAGGVEAACTYPFEFAKTRVQLYGHEGVRNPFWVVAKVAREEGARALYKGCSTMIVGSIGKDAVRFVAFDSIRAFFEDPETRRLGTLQSIGSGMVAGVISSTAIVTPSERVKTALIDDARTARRFRSPAHCLRLLAAEQGLRRALYSGYAATTLKQVGTTGFRLGSYGAIKDLERPWGVDVDGALASFANGAAAGTVTTLATQPFDTVKTQAQRATGAGSTLECARAVIAEDGVRGLWRGTVMRLGRTVMAGGILFTANEQASKVLRALLGQ